MADFNSAWHVTGKTEESPNAVSAAGGWATDKSRCEEVLNARNKFLIDRKETVKLKFFLF